MRDPAKVIFPVVMATLMSFIMSGLVTAINLGIGPRFLSQWLGAWSMTGPIAVVGVLVASPVAARITGWIVARLPRRPADARGDR